MTDKTKEELEEKEPQVVEEVIVEEPEVIEEYETESELSREELEKNLAEKTELAAKHFQSLARTQADFENFRRRTRQEREDLLKYAGESIIVKILPVLDNFERALASAKDPQEEFVVGVKMIYRQIEEALKSEGVEKLSTTGVEFDPQKHEAVMQVDSDSHAENIIVEELRPGYTLQGKVLRPAMVKVAK